eukprot:Sspe_Gene.54672::Locus_30145_Transcript_1_1_Confidence_1.000_Length_2348::g.54672::m.54672
MHPDRVTTDQVTPQGGLLPPPSLCVIHPSHVAMVWLLRQRPPLRSFTSAPEKLTPAFYQKDRLAFQASPDAALQGCTNTQEAANWLRRRYSKDFTRRLSPKALQGKLLDDLHLIQNS